jgi:NADH-quinone oxidoreductase subunit C/D
MSTTSTTEAPGIVRQMESRIPNAVLGHQPTADGVPTVWVAADRVGEVLRFLKKEVPQPYAMLFDLTAIDERERTHRADQPASDFTIVYHLLSFDRNSDVRVKVPLTGPSPSIRTVTDLWPNANWYEREVWDMFGIHFAGHPFQKRILSPPWWEGHPLRKEHHARATEAGPFQMPEARAVALGETMVLHPKEWGLSDRGEHFDSMFLNFGPHHPGTHGVFRVVLQMEGQEIVDLACDIGYHHRGAEKMGERQSWHTYIPYTDRVDYLGGVMNNLPYVMAVEKLAGIPGPHRAKVIRIMMSELFRIISHLVYYGTFSQDLGMMSPVFYMFSDRERAFDIVEAITGGRMHPSWFRIGGVAQDLPQGWDRMVREFLDYLPARLRDYDRTVIDNAILKARTKDISAISVDEAIEWGATGPMLRACGLEWDLRKKRPYGGYDQFEFDIPTGRQGDCHDRAFVHAEEMRQSLRIIEQCLENMPAGPYKSDHPLTTPPLRERTMHDIETLINHFLGVTWGPVIPPGEASCLVEATKGLNGYYLVSDGNTMSYRTRIRTPSFAHLQMVPTLARGLMIPDLIAILASVDYVLADSDR